jgi:hypothetical protein
MFNSTFETKTDLVRFTVHVNDGSDRAFPVESYEQGILNVRSFLAMGIGSQLVIEHAFYSKWVYALSYNGGWLFKYGLIWKRIN